MRKLQFCWLLTFFVEINGTIDPNEIQKLLQWKTQHLFNLSEIGAVSNGVFDFSDLKNKIIQWKTQKLNALCPSNGEYSVYPYELQNCSQRSAFRAGRDLNFYPEKLRKFYGMSKETFYWLLENMRDSLKKQENNWRKPICPAEKLLITLRVQLQNLLNIACSTAQATNVTIRDACIQCFSRVTSMPEGPQELNALSACAMQYFVNTTYGPCATALTALATSALNVQPSGCFTGYCDFARCLRRVNSVNLITQCTREARTGIDIAKDDDNVRFYTNVTSCILAKSRCGSFNPITGDPQTPGYTSTGIRVSNALQISDAGELRIFAFPMNTPVALSFCSTSTNLTESSWLTNVC